MITIGEKVLLPRGHTHKYGYVRALMTASSGKTYVLLTPRVDGGAKIYLNIYELTKFSDAK